MKTKDSKTYPNGTDNVRQDKPRQDKIRQYKPRQTKIDNDKTR